MINQKQPRTDTDVKQQIRILSRYYKCTAYIQKVRDMEDLKNFKLPEMKTTMYKIKKKIHWLGLTAD